MATDTITTVNRLPLDAALGSVEKKVEPKPKYEQQKPERQEVRNRVMSRINEFKSLRQQSQPLLRDRILTEYWDDSVKRFIQYKQRPAYKEWWQANTADSTPVDKVIGILSKLAAQSMEAVVFATQESSWLTYWKEKLLTYLLRAAGRKNRDDYQLVLEELSAMAKGTVIGFEGWYRGKRNIREVVSVDPATGEVKFKVKTIAEWNDVLSTLIPVEDFYPGSVNVRPGCIQDMDDCAIRRVISKSKFAAEFGRYADADKVITKNQVSPEDELFYQQYQHLGADDVEVWYYFNKQADEFCLIANHIWINPLGKADVSPLWWNHKQLPLWAGVLEPFAENFFYGRSLPDKLATMVDMHDALFDRMLDQLTIAVHKPIVTTRSATSITKGYLTPNNVIQVKGANLASDFKTLDIDTPGPVYFSMLQMIRGNMDRATVANEPIGKSGGGNPKTATEIMQVREAALELVGLFLRFMEFAIREKNRLRLSNILQFYTLPIHAGEKEVKYRKVKLREQLLRGRIGDVEIHFTNEDTAKMQTKLEQEAYMVPGMPVKFAVHPDFIRDFDGDVEIVPTSSVKQTKSTRQVLELNWQKVAAELFPDKVNRDAAFEDLARVFDKDVTRLRTPGGQMNPMAMLEQGMGSTPGMPAMQNAMPRAEQLAAPALTPPLREATSV